jgi:hypothetical protein
MLALFLDKQKAEWLCIVCRWVRACAGTTERKIVDDIRSR